MKFSRLILTLIIAFLAMHAQAQMGDKLANQVDSFSSMPTKYVTQVSGKVNQLQEKLEKNSDRALNQMLAEEKRIQSKLSKIDSFNARKIFADGEQQYRSFREKLIGKTTVLRQYIPSLDTLSTSLKFFRQNQELLARTKEAKDKLDKALSSVKGLDDKLQQAEQIEAFLKERKEYLQQQLQQLGFAKGLTRLNKQLYYYDQQLNEYKALLKDHKKAERKGIALLSKTKLFQDFMRKNSMLASLFRMPDDPDDPASVANLTGLQTKAQVNGFIQQQMASGGSNAQAMVEGNLQKAQSGIQALKDRFVQAGNKNSSDILPEGFKPNNQKIQSFFKRLEYGTNMQTQRATNFFPITSDLGLSIGYKLNDKSVIGLGTSYKLGFGRGWNHIQFTQEGAGFRSYLDWKLKGSFWLSGGYEMNYKTSFNSIEQLKAFNAWQQSGLIGLSKVLDIKSKLFKKTKLQLLWDFLSYQQIPKTQPLVFRVGYSIK